MVCAGILGIAMWVIISLLPAQPRSNTPSPFRFVGTPGVSTGLVTFQITNEGRDVILYAALPLQVRSNGQWIDLQSVPLSRAATLVSPEKVSTIIVSAPLNNLPWRVPLSWSYGPTRLQLLKWRAENLLHHQRRNAGLENHMAYSPEITP